MWSPPEITSWKKCPVTVCIVLLSIGSSLLVWWSGRDISAFLCNFEVSQGQVYRLLSCTLLHFNLFHLAFDVCCFYVFGCLIESLFGHVWAFLIYVLLATVSSAAQYGLAGGGVGLSGICYGLFGLLWMLGRNDNRLSKIINPQTAGIMLTWFILCIVTTRAGWMPVGNVSHAAGLIMGVLMGLSLTMRDVGRNVSIGLAVAFGLICFPGALVLRPVINTEANLGKEFADLGSRAKEANRFQESAEYYQKAIEFDPKQGDYYYHLGEVLGELDRYDEAVTAFAEASKLSSDSTGSDRAGVQLAAQGVRALQSGRLVEAVKLYQQATEIDPKEAGHWYNLAVAQARMNQFHKALPNFEQATKLAPGDQDYRKEFLWCKTIVSKVDEDKAKKGKDKLQK